MIKTFVKTCLIFSIALLYSCDFLKNKKEEIIDTTKKKDSISANLDLSDNYFEGEIKLSESRGLYGSLTKVYTTYYISENTIKREQNLGGIYGVLDNYAGIIINLEKDSVVLYYADKLSNTKNKHTLSINQYKLNLKTNNLPKGIPSPFDNTFTLLTDYKLINQVPDSTVIKGFNSDYTLYKDDSEILKQELFDSKEIIIKRELLEMIFINLPKEINFPLKSEVKTTISDISNDSIVNGEQTKAIDRFVRGFLREGDSTINKESDLKKLSKNKLIGIGLDIFKAGVNMNIHITSDLSEASNKVIKGIDISLSLSDFKEIDDFDDFINALPSSGSIDFDD